MKKYFIFLVLSIFVCQANAQDESGQKELSKALFGMLQKKEYAKVEAYFDTAFARRMTVERLETLWKFVLEQGGAYVKTKDITREIKPGFIIVSQILEFEKKEYEFKVAFKKKDVVASMSFVPYHPVEDYKLPSYYDSTKVVERRVKIVSGKFNLPGTVSQPAGGGKFPLVILVHGAGANDRDETVGATKLFKDIALGLSMKGIAVLRYEKRSKVSFGKMMQTRNTMTVNDETIDDVIAAAQLMKGDSSIDTNRIYLLGHSMGGMLLPRIAREMPEVAGLIMIAANARPLEDMIFEQSQSMLLRDSLTERKRGFLDSLRVHVDRIKHLTPESLNDTTIKTLLAFPKSYWLDLNMYHQLDVAKKSDVPMLILHGERDYQVPVLDFNMWKKELAERTNVQLKLYPKLNHLFQEGSGKSSPADYDKRGNVPVYVINDIATWMLSKKK